MLFVPDPLDLDAAIVEQMDAKRRLVRAETRLAHIGDLAVLGLGPYLGAQRASFEPPFTTSHRSTVPLILGEVLADSDQPEHLSSWSLKVEVGGPAHRAP